MTAVSTGSESGAGYTARVKGGRLRAMQCPRCHLENPPSADVCDCGYSFVTGSYVPKVSSRSETKLSGGPEKSRYFALENISRGCRVASWLAAILMALAGIAVLFNLTEQQKTAFGIPAAIALFGSAVLQWLLFRGIAEAIILFVDIAYDVRAIATKLNG